MQREIKFRGKRIDYGAWVYGYLIETKSNKVDGEHSSYIMERPIIIPGITIPAEWFMGVDPGTVGQYTGRKVNGVEIYEGDILKRITGYIVIVKLITWISGDRKLLTYDIHEDDIIIGNVYENPELTAKL